MSGEYDEEYLHDLHDSTRLLMLLKLYKLVQLTLIGLFRFALYGRFARRGVPS